MGLLSPQELKQYRAKVGLSQRNLAELTGLSPNTIALYELVELHHEYASNFILMVNYQNMYNYFHTHSKASPGCQLVVSA